MSKNVIGTVIPLGLILIAVAALIWVNKSEKEDIAELLEHGKTTTGVLYDTGGEHIKYRFWVDGKEYFKGRKEPYNYLQDTEEYEVKYLSEDPEENFMNFKSPILSDKYEYGEVECLSVEKTQATVRFRYNVQDETFTRKKFFNEGEPLGVKNYVVRYRKSNPQIGYLIRKQ